MKKSVIRKIGVYNLMLMLEELHNKGVDYVDLVGSSGEEEDVLGLIFNEDYINPDFRESFEKDMNEEEEDETDILFTPEEPENEKPKLSDKDLDQML